MAGSAWPWAPYRLKPRPPKTLAHWTSRCWCWTPSAILHTHFLASASVHRPWCRVCCHAPSSGLRWVWHCCSATGLCSHGLTWGRLWRHSLTLSCCWHRPTGQPVCRAVLSRHWSTHRSSLFLLVRHSAIHHFGLILFVSHASTHHFGRRLLGCGIGRTTFSFTSFHGGTPEHLNFGI